MKVITACKNYKIKRSSQNELILHISIKSASLADSISLFYVIVCSIGWPINGLQNRTQN